MPVNGSVTIPYLPLHIAWKHALKLQTDTILFVILDMTELAQVRNVKISAIYLTTKAAFTLIQLAQVLAISGTNCTKRTSNKWFSTGRIKRDVYPFAKQS